MSRNNLIITAALLATVAICFIPSRLYTKVAEPDPATTGAPGESTCSQANCHTGNLINLDPAKLRLISIGTPSINNGYTPNTQYNLSVNLSSGTTGYGFQLTALDQNNNAAGTLSVTNATTTSLNPSGGRQYIGHKNANSTNAWVFRWQAPPTDIGAVTFYFTGCGTNSDSLETGDVVYRAQAVATTSSFSQLTLTGIQPINADEVDEIKIYPNPFSDRLSVSSTWYGDSRLKIELFDINGRLVKQLDDRALSHGNYRNEFDLAGEINSGLYLLKLTYGARVYYKKLVRD